MNDKRRIVMELIVNELITGETEEEVVETAARLADMIIKATRLNDEWPELRFDDE